MAEIQYGEDQLGEGTSARELRRTYHDRIAEVRERSLDMLRCSIAGVSSAALVLAGRPGAEEPVPACSLEDMRALASAVDAEVVSLLALESPMARDLRVIVASRDVTQIGLLCVGLCASLASRVGRAEAALDSDRSELIGRITSDTEGVLRDADACWAALDPSLASNVERSAVEVRALQTDFLTSLVGLVGVPMEVAIDLAMVTRALERLVDHAVEIAERVLFVAGGSASPAPEQ